VQTNYENSGNQGGRRRRTITFGNYHLTGGFSQKKEHLEEQRGEEERELNASEKTGTGSDAEPEREIQSQDLCKMREESNILT